MTELDLGPVNILIVDDDPALRGLVRDFLVEQGHSVFEAEDARSMRQVLAEAQVQILILDIMMPGEDGLSIARSLTRDDSDMGIIMVSALGSESDRITGLEAGADDYLPKPISPRELLARIRAFQRRWQLRQGKAGGIWNYEFEGWRLDPVRRVLRDPAGVIISLSEGEFGVLLVLVERPQTVLSRDQMLDLSRGRDADTFDRAVDTQVSRLRRKLSARAAGQFISTVRNEGYIFLPAVRRV